MEYPLVGLKLLAVTPDGRLTSPLFPSVAWNNSTELHARCPHEGHATAPVENCSCGFHAAYSYNAINVHMHTGYTYALGLMSGWGKIIVSTRGFRSEFAKLDSIIGVYTHRRGGSSIVKNETFFDIIFDLTKKYTYSDQIVASTDDRQYACSRSIDLSNLPKKGKKLAEKLQIPHITCTNAIEIVKIYRELNYVCDNIAQNTFVTVFSSQNA